jgi:pantoate--beta-alanine ligase
MSSRNAYLDPEERKKALVLHRSLTRLHHMIEHGETSAEKLVAAGHSEFAGESSVRLDYFEIVHPDTLEPIQHIDNGALIAVAAYVGSTRLIDNLLIRR